MIDTNALRSAVDSAARGPAAAAALCFGKIPRKLLTKALEAYAPKAASEEAIALVPSEGSGKSGFLLTDKALYFHATLGSFRYRFPYEDIVAVNKTNARLRIATATDTMEWNLASGDQLLWERSRQNAAEFVATVLATALQGDKPSIASGAPAQTPNPGPTVIIEHSVSTDFGRALAFHATVLVVGVPSLLLALFALFKFDPPYLYHISTALERFIHSGGTGSSLTLLCAMWLGPPVYAFGTSLRFSITRYVVALLFVAFAALQLSLRVRGTIAGPFVIPLGGGALGIVLTLTLGNIGLAIRRWIMRFAQR